MTLMLTKESKWSKILAKSALVSILAFSVGTGSVLASDNLTTSSDVSVTQNTAASLQADTTLNESETETPDLLPGEFFYFVKTIYENIQMALTVNDVKEARLLTAFAQERLAESNALFTQGKLEEAKLYLQKSLETQQSAVQKADQASDTSTTITNTQAEASVSIASAVATAVQQGSEQTVDSDKSEFKDVAAPVKETKKQEKVLKIKTDLQHNIVALASALEKVNNPKAQLALMKNIQKAFAHLDKKLSKLENKALLGQTNENVIVEEERPPVAQLAPTPVPEAAPIKPALVQVEQGSKVAAKVSPKKKDEAKPETNKSDKAKERKNANQLDDERKENGKGKGNNKGNNKDSKQE